MTREYYEAHKDKILEQNRRYKQRNKEKIAQINKKYREENKERIRETQRRWEKANPEKVRESGARKQRTYRENHKDSVREYGKQYQTNRKATDGLYKFKVGLRSMISQSFSRCGVKKNATAENILGCSIEEFKSYIESQFVDGMSFDNYGEWHLDHIKPLATAKTIDDVIVLCHYTNFQPLWAEDNRRKSGKYNDHTNEGG